MKLRSAAERLWLVARDAHLTECHCLEFFDLFGSNAQKRHPPPPPLSLPSSL